ncbi:MAG: plasmid recombination protein [Oscillospiraceae bacterium]|jgi:hypothetical protein|nr:plasmid recombination protein [Oscillospiraceae bacterium]
MLDEYMRGFKKRNPNLRVFCSNLHMDETTPHLHVNFVPFYTEQKKIGMSQGVSMKSALIEQGFIPQNMKLNHLVLWENAKHAHQSVPEYKASQDWKKLPKRKKDLSTLEVYHENLQVAQNENALLKLENGKLLTEKNSPYKSFYFSDPDKQIFVQNKLDDLNIPYRENENGFE